MCKERDMSALLQIKDVDMALKDILKPQAGDYDIFESEEYKKVVRAFSELSLDAFGDVINGALFFRELAIGNASSSAISDVVRILAEQDFEALKKYNQAVVAIGSMDLDEKSRNALVKQIYNSIEPAINEQNSSLIDVSTEFVRKAEKASASFSTMKNETKAELVHDIFQNCTRRMKNFWQRIEPEKFKGVVDTLMGELGRDNFSEEEIIELSSRCATIFCESTREKILGIEKVFEEYKDYVILMSETAHEMSADTIEKFKNISFKQILKRAGSIAKSTPELIEETSKLLRGSSVGEIFEERSKKDDRFNSLFNEFKNAKIDLSLSDMIWVMHKNPSVFGASVENTLLSLKIIKESMIKSYGEKTQKVDFSALLTRDNFLKGMPKTTHPEDIEKSIELLSSVIPAGELVTFLQNDMRILDVPYDRLQSTIVNVLVSNKTMDGLVEELGNALTSKIYEMVSKKQGDKIKEDQNVDVAKSLDAISSRINVSFESSVMEDLVFDLDFAKLKTFLGPYFEEFEKRFKTSNIDTNSINEVLERTRVSSRKVEMYQRVNSAKISLDGKNVQGYVHDKKGSGIDIIELLWQLHRNMQSEIGLIKRFVQNPDLTTAEKQMYITSTNYFKLAVERDDVLDFTKNPDRQLRDAVFAAKTMVDDSFMELTKLFSKFIKSNRDIIDRKAEELEEQKNILESRLSENSFVSLVGSSVEIMSKREYLKKELEIVKEKFDKASRIYSKSKQAIREKKKEIKEERLNPSQKKAGDEISKGENLTVFAMLDESARLVKLESELGGLIQNHEGNKEKLDFLMQQINNNQKLLTELSLIENYDSISESTKQKIKSIKSRLDHVYHVKHLIEQDEDSQSGK